ncbi:MAG: cell division protein FtsZ, partial [Legionellales bacterium]
VLLGAVKGISDLITRPGLINVDFADVRTVMSEMGMAMMGTGTAIGEQRARQAAEAAIASPLLEDVNFSGARGILVNITAGLDMSIGEFEEVGDVVKEFISDDATVVVGTVIDPEMTDEMRVTVIVTGLGDTRQGATQQHQQHHQSSHRTRVAETTRSDGSVDYRHLDRPAVLRKQTQVAASRPTRQAVESVPDVDYLDIPAFLRREEEA